MNDLRSMTIEEITAALQEMGQPSFRGAQIFAWVQEKKVRSFDEMTNLPKTLRERLAEAFSLSLLTIEQKLISQEDRTRKYVYALPDGLLIESVFMPYDYGNTACISSQAGCRMGCRFCASTLEGLARNLLPGEMLEQIFRMEEDTGEKISHVVVMGSGEPLDNYDNLLRFIALITHEKGKHLSERNITVSTCGLVSQIRRLAGEHLQITLALSLHAPNDALRKTMMPIANAYSVQETVAACDEYFNATGRRMSYEYSLVRGVNDTDACAQELAALLHGKNAHVNLIPINPIKERDYLAPERSAALRFQKRLENLGINATIRKKMGADIDSACGQLRLKLRTKQGE